MSLMLSGAVLMKVVIPMGAVGAAVWAQDEGIGLFAWLPLPPILTLVASLLLVDLFIYVQHVATHHIPVLWRFHKVHHMDTDLDVTSGVRFHPIEMLASLIYKIAIVVALGVPPGAVILFEVILNALSLFNHSNMRIPPGIDRWVRYVIVTPDVHRVHHSPKPHETNANFGFSLIWWDRLFGTYRAQPEQAHTSMTLGIDEVDPAGARSVPYLLLAPFRTGHTDRDQQTPT